MKKILLIFLFTCTTKVIAQCPITVTGNNGVCVGVTDTLTASGATSYTWMPSGDTGASIIVTPTVTTTYTVTANTGTCTATNTINVVVHPLPAVTFTTNFDYVFNVLHIYPSYSSNVINASWEINVFSYSFYPYATSGFYSRFYGLYPNTTMTITNPGTGSYVTNYTICVMVGDSFGCSDTSSFCCINPSAYCGGEYPCTWCDTNSTSAIGYDVFVSQNPTTGVNKLPVNANQISIYPNPSSGVFNLSISQLDNEKASNIEIYNLIGECVYKQVIQPTPKPSREGNSITIDASSLPNGIYNLSISSNEGIVNKRVIIVK